MARSQKSYNSSKNPLLCIHLTSLALFGLWPFQTEEFLGKKFLRSVHFAAGFFIYFLFFIFLITEYIELYHVWGNLEDMTTNMTVSCLYTIGVMKIYAFFGHRSKLKLLINDVSMIETNILKYQSSRVKNILHEYIAFARKVTYFFWMLCFLTISVFFVIPPLEYRFSSTYHIVYENGTEFWSYERPMIFSSWFPFDKYAFPNYLVAYMYQMTMGTIGASYQGVWDMFTVSMMIHSIGQLKILQRILIDSTRNETIDNEPIEKSKGNRSVFSKCGWNSLIEGKEMWDEIKRRRLVDCVNHHRYIIRYTHDLNTILSPVMMLYFMVCSIMLCAIGFQASLYGFSIRLCFMVEYLIALMIQLFLFYWHGNEVIQENEKLHFATYSCDWYKEAKGFKTSLLIMREGIKLPIRFKVGQFYAMSLPTFLAILRASYSYFALLRQVQEEIG